MTNVKPPSRAPKTLRRKPPESIAAAHSEGSFRRNHERSPPVIRNRVAIRHKTGGERQTPRRHPGESRSPAFSPTTRHPGESRGPGFSPTTSASSPRRKPGSRLLPHPPWVPASAGMTTEEQATGDDPRREAGGGRREAGGDKKVRHSTVVVKRNCPLSPAHRHPGESRGPGRAGGAENQSPATALPPPTLGPGFRRDDDRIATRCSHTS
jgi:hypothetical protein